MEVTTEVNVAISGKFYATGPRDKLNERLSNLKRDAIKKNRQFQVAELSIISIYFYSSKTPCLKLEAISVSMVLLVCSFKVFMGANDRLGAFSL